MLRRLLSIIVTLAFLLCGATIAMEALGLMFADGDADPDQTTEAFIAEIEADQDNVNVPREAGAERLWPPADRREMAGRMEDSERQAAEIAPLAVSLPDGGKPAPVAVTAEWAPLIVVEARPEVESEPHPETAHVPDAAPSAPVVVAGRIDAPPETAAAAADCGAAGCRAKQAKPRRSRPTGGAERRRASRAASHNDCPFFGWL